MNSCAWLVLRQVHHPSKRLPVTDEYIYQLQYYITYLATGVGNVAANHPGYFAVAGHEALPRHRTKSTGYRVATKLNMVFCQSGTSKNGGTTYMSAFFLFFIKVF